MDILNYSKIIEELKQNQVEFTKAPSNLLCISASDEYWNADVKVMFFGQETNDWVGSFSNQADIDHLLDVYDNFFNSGYCYKYGGQFWNGVSKLKSELISLCNESHKSVALTWNNVIKIGLYREKGLPPEDVLIWQDSLFELIRHEIVFFKPDIIIFFSGPYYDRFLKRAFPDISFQSIAFKTERQLARLTSQHIPTASIRTYHPNYLWRNGFYDYLEAILGELRI